jgi:hypothetical protein
MYAPILLCVLVAGGSATGEAKKADTVRFTTYPKVVASHKASVGVQVDRGLLARADVWLGVIPHEAHDSIWLQGARVVTPTSRRLIHLGLPVVLPRTEEFDVVILSCKKGTIKKAMEVKMSDLEDLGIEVVQTVTIKRVR